ncbi:MAG: ATP-binding cassette domain-containing protein [Opitutales bacterium]
MQLLAYRNLSLSFGGPQLLDCAHLSIAKQERICLVGRNGCGKSSLLRLLNSELTPDKGEYECMPNLRIQKLDQHIPSELTGSVFDVVASGLGPAYQIVNEYNELLSKISETAHADHLLEALNRAESKMDTIDGWTLENKIERTLNRMDLEGSACFKSLSGGNKRRVLLARALVSDPHILLLDEPTNHLDIPAIAWLEKFLSKSNCALLFISHDRTFIAQVANRILDLDRGQLTSWNCNYETYLSRKAAHLAAEAKQAAVFDKKLAEEERWIRQGIQARRTRNEGRVRALHKMRAERRERREKIGTSQLRLNDAQLSGRKVIEVENLSYRWSEQTGIQAFSTQIWRGDKVGITGRNGSGKTTLLKLLLRQLVPSSGTVTHGTQLEIAYFDQQRDQLDPNLNVAENLLASGDSVSINGKEKHILSYLQDFLFSPETARAPIHRLSGGERARLLLARLFLQPANLLVLDEPSNDLDLETLELLEERLLDYQGTLLIVSHDRAFLENVVTSTLHISSKGVVEERIGYWDANDPAKMPSTGSTITTSSRQKKDSAKNLQISKGSKRTLSNKERAAIAALPELIEELEMQNEALSHKMASPNYYKESASQAKQDSEKLDQLNEEILAAYSEWEALENEI